MHPSRQPPPPIFPAWPADSQTPAGMDPSTDQASFPSSPPRMASQPLLFQLSSMISHYETIPHMYPCLYPSSCQTHSQNSTLHLSHFCLCTIVLGKPAVLSSHPCLGTWSGTREGCLPSHHTFLSSHSPLLFNPNLTASLASIPL